MKEITTSVERVQLQLCNIISEIVEVERLIKNRPKLRKALTKAPGKASSMRQQLLRAKVELNGALEYIGKRDTYYRKSIGRQRPRPASKQKCFEGI